MGGENRSVLSHAPLGTNNFRKAASRKGLATKPLRTCSAARCCCDMTAAGHLTHSPAPPVSAKPPKPIPIGVEDLSSVRSISNLVNNTTSF